MARPEKIRGVALRSGARSARKAPEWAFRTTKARGHSRGLEVRPYRQHALKPTDYANPADFAASRIFIRAASLVTG